jgi:hypothetical protein
VWLDAESFFTDVVRVWRKQDQLGDSFAQGTRFVWVGDRRSAIVVALPSAGRSYTAIVRGANGTTGVAGVEVYALN